jgi:hypothetical protein
MTEQDALLLLNEAGAIDLGELANAEALANGTMGPGGVIMAADPQAAAKEWFIIPKTLAWAITAVFPELAPCYTDAKCMELAEAIVPVAEKYGVSGIGDSPELTLIMGTGIFCMPAVMAYRERQAARAAEAEAKRLGGAARAPQGQQDTQGGAYQATAQVTRGQHGD